MTTDIVKKDDGTMALIIDKEELLKLKKISEDTNHKYAGLSSIGVVVADEEYPEIYCGITRVLS